MSVRLFHRGRRTVLAGATREDTHVWYALRRRGVAWEDLFAPALSLLGFDPRPAPQGLVFGDGRIDWTPGALWTTIRLRLPPCSERKRALLAAGLLKAARYAEIRGGDHADRQ